jgi:hypothetical protein
MIAQDQNDATISTIITIFTVKVARKKSASSEKSIGVSMACLPDVSCPDYSCAEIVVAALVHPCPERKPGYARLVAKKGRSV